MCVCVCVCVCVIGHRDVKIWYILSINFLSVEVSPFCTGLIGFNMLPHFQSASVGVLKNPK